MSFCNGKLKRTIILTEEEINNNPIWKGFYPLITSKLEVANYDDVKSLDCKEIEISPNIQDIWFKQNREQGRADWELAMLLLNSAPKVDDTLSDNTVIISDRFMTIKTEQYDGIFSKGR